LAICHQHMRISPKRNPDDVAGAYRMALRLNTRERLFEAAGDPKGPLFRTIGRGTDTLTATPLPQANAYAMIRRRAGGADIATKIGNHTFRATGITAYLKNGGTPLPVVGRQCEPASPKIASLGLKTRRQTLSLRPPAGSTNGKGMTSRLPPPVRAGIGHVRKTLCNEFPHSRPFRSGVGNHLISDIVPLRLPDPSRRFSAELRALHVSVFSIRPLVRIGRPFRQFWPARRSSTLRSDNGYLTYIITSRRMTSGELLNIGTGCS
jgi:hypothetical protein